MTRVRQSAVAILLAFVAGCGQAGTDPSTSSPLSACDRKAAGATSSATNLEAGDLVLIGRIVTMDEPPIAEALFIEDGTVVAVGTRDDVLARACDDTPIIDLGEGVAYPGLVDAHAHWIGDRDYYGVDSAAEAMDLAATRGWTSISEQWVNPEKLEELTRLAADDALPLRVDAYLALNFEKKFLGDWYLEREPGSIDDHLRVRGVKIHLDHGLLGPINWERADLIDAIGRADEAGWQVSVHSTRAPAIDLVLDAFEAALGPTGPNPLHHRIEHAIQVTAEQLARLVAMDLVTVIHLDGARDWILGDAARDRFERDEPDARIDWVARWRDFVDAGLHVASATDAPWTFMDFVLAADQGRPVDQIAAGMDGQARTQPETPAWLRDQLLTAEQGLRAVTLDAAYALGDEARRGHLAPDTLGDVTILSGDVTTASPDEIRAMTVVATIVGGTVVHCSVPEVCRGAWGPAGPER
ncbi:MAG TPA: amidohydrolase family protein [Candidatus Limnocylindrales bacterium]|nr:amidohydrolase family protein [Candidatus Limnocylindrales bacterium]HSG87478.1 amidohydrolase family protein [Candidatus Limnocylindrales bacterium]